MDQLNPSGAEHSYDAGKNPVVVANLGGNVFLYVADPEMMLDLFVKKNTIFDKTGNFRGIFSRLFGDAIAFRHADEVWKAQRKACAHAFYKERIVHMLEVLKDKIEEDCERWAAEIVASPDASKVIDISKVFITL